MFESLGATARPLSDQAENPGPFIWADDDEVPVCGETVAKAVSEPVLLLPSDSSLWLTPAHLERLSDGQLTVSIRTTREIAKGAAQNQVTVYVETPEAGLLPHKSLSGGQKFRVDVAIRIGLWEAMVPPVESEQIHYRHNPAPTNVEAALPSFHSTRGGTYRSPEWGPPAHGR